MEEYIEAAKKKALEILQKETIAPLDLEALSVLSKIICDANAFVAMSLKNRLSQSRGVSRAWTGVNLEDFVSTLKEDLQDALSSQKDCHTPFDSRGNLEECGEPMNKPD